MREVKFRAWVKDFTDIRKDRMHEWNNEFFSDMSPVTGYGSGFPDKDDDSVILMEWSGLKDKHDIDIYEGDIVYLAGLGNMEIEFPFIDLYYAGMEKDIGAILGNIYENPELVEK